MYADRRQAVRQELFDEIRTLFEVGIPSGRSPASSVLVADGWNVGFVASICRTSTQWPQSLAPRRISALCWRGVGPKALPKSGTCSLRYAIVAIPGPTVTRFLAPWRSGEPSFDGDEQVRAKQEEPAPVRVRTLDPMTGRPDLAAYRGGTFALNPVAKKIPLGRSPTSMR